MGPVKVNVFLLPQKSVSPQINYTEVDMEKDPVYQKIARIIERSLQDASRRKQKKCDISIDVETHKIPPLRKLLERKGYSIFVQGVYPV
ncbi:MAG: hypothetical protein HY051_05520 [Candidatus Aenigmarchaeota archaeon]|nr:hypothetical protein [Candidatus Aenigmarchaeota archaeon]